MLSLRWIWTRFPQNRRRRLDKSLKAISLALVILALTGCAGLGGGVKQKRETGRSFLVTDLAEGKGYGLYSYLLFGSPPTDATRERYLKAIEAYLLLPDIVELGRYLERHELNITYLPVDAPPPPVKVSPEFVFEH